MVAIGPFLLRALIYRSRDGDEEAFEKLVGLHHAELLYYVRKLLGSLPAAEDVVQDVWLAVHQQLHRLRDVGAFETWLFRIARNRAMEALRVRRQRSIDDVAEPPAHDHEPQFTPEDAAKVHAALANLKLEHRDVLTLRFLRDMSYEQIAQITGADLGTVKSRIYYGKQALRREMEKSS